MVTRPNGRRARKRGSGDELPPCPRVGMERRRRGWQCDAEGDLQIGRADADRRVLARCLPVQPTRASGAACFVCPRCGQTGTWKPLAMPTHSAATFGSSSAPSDDLCRVRPTIGRRTSAPTPPTTAGRRPARRSSPAGRPSRTGCGAAWPPRPSETPAAARRPRRWPRSGPRCSWPAAGRCA
jgi:hypothetical protein